MNSLFNDSYKILKILGSGGMGTVYLAEHVKLGTKWAIKAIRKSAGEGIDLLAEPNILKKLNHPALPRIIDIEQDAENIYIIEDFIEGTPLDKQLKVQGRFDESIVVDWAKQLCNIFIYLHSQRPNPIIYRDMKPANIIVSPNNVVKVIDFGIAREFKQNSGTDTSYMGTRGYAAPEQYGTSQTDGRTDIYSLGVTMYHLLTGKSPNEPPYEFKPLRMINKSFSEGIEFIVNKCVQSDPAMRYQSAQELLHDLENIHTFNSYYKKQKLFDNIWLTIKLVGFAACFAMVFVGSKFVSAERVERYNNLIEKGIELVGEFEYHKAEQYFKEAIKMEDKEPEPRLDLAMIKLKQGDFEECESYLRDLVHKLPECEGTAQYNYLMGSIYYEYADFEKALEHYEKAYGMDKTNNAYPRDLAVCYAKLGMLDEAEELLGLIPEDGENDGIISYIKGQVQYSKGDFDGAVDNFERVISVSHDEDLQTHAYIELANMYKSLSHQDKSAVDKQIQVLERAEDNLHSKDNPIILEALAQAYFNAGMYDKSIEKFEKLLHLGYNRPYIYRNIAIIYQNVENYDKAEETLKTMEDKYPEEYICYVQYAYLYMEIESKKPAESRDYTRVQQYYDLAVRNSLEGENASEILQLKAKINELRSKGWLN